MEGIRGVNLLEPYGIADHAPQSLFLAGTASGERPADGTTDFWNKKPPSQWTHEEIDRLITKSRGPRT